MPINPKFLLTNSYSHMQSNTDATMEYDVAVRFACAALKAGNTFATNSILDLAQEFVASARHRGMIAESPLSIEQQGAVIGHFDAATRIAYDTVMVSATLHTPWNADEVKDIVASSKKED